MQLIRSVWFQRRFIDLITTLQQVYVGLDDTSLSLLLQIKKEKAVVDYSKMVESRKKTATAMLCA